MRNVRLAPPFRQRGMLRLGALSGMWGKVPAAAGASFLVDAADFDGTNDYLRRNATMTGEADSKTGILSFWVFADSVANNPSILGATDSPVSLGSAIDVQLRSTGDLLIQVNSTSATILNMQTNGHPLTVSAWHHVLASWDLAAAVRQLYIDDVAISAFVANSSSNAAAFYASAADWWIGTSWFDAAGGKLNGGLAEFYFAPGQTLDLSVTSNRRKFISSSLKPVDLGATGSTPTGVAPLIFQHLDDGEAAANFATNRTSAGNFTVTGALTTFASSPSD